MKSTEHGSRLPLVAGVAGALVIAALSWLVVISPLRSSTETLRADTAAVQDQNAAIEATQASLSDAAGHRDELVAAARAALAALPPGPQLPGFNRQLAHQAKARGVTVTSISVGATSTAATTAGQAAPATAALAIPVTVQSSGAIYDQLLFLHDLQQVGPRRALVTSTSLAPGLLSQAIGRDSTMTVQITVFSAPLTAAVRQQLATAMRHDDAG